jgi:hypothetical protein
LALGEGYEVRTLLGQGGFGLVFTAFDKRLKRDLAVKVLRTELARSGSFLDRFEREAMTAAQLRHPNIVPIYSIGEKDGLAYIVMPLIHGETLQALLERDGPLPLPETCRILVDAAAALSAAHHVGLIHRDIKPDNIMLEGPERRVLLMDFGIAKMMRNTDATLTGTGVLIGTPLYMSPEQAGGDRDVDQRSDIYSLGIVAYHMLTGKPPFGGTSGADLIRHHVLTPAADVRLSRPNVPTMLAGTVMRCLRKERDKRWQTAEELRNALAAAAVLPASGRTRSSIFRMTAQARQHRYPLFALVLLAVAGHGLGGASKPDRAPAACCPGGDRPGGTSGGSGGQPAGGVERGGRLRPAARGNRRCPRVTAIRRRLGAPAGRLVRGRWTEGGSGGTAHHRVRTLGEGGTRRPDERHGQQLGIGPLIGDPAVRIADIPIRRRHPEPRRPGGSLRLAGHRELLSRVGPSRRVAPTGRGQAAAAQSQLGR